MQVKKRKGSGLIGRLFAWVTAWMVNIRGTGRITERS